MPRPVTRRTPVPIIPKVKPKPALPPVSAWITHIVKMLKADGLSEADIQEVCELEWLSHGDDWPEHLIHELNDMARDKLLAKPPLERRGSLSLAILRDTLRKTRQNPDGGDPSGSATR